MISEKPILFEWCSWLKFNRMETRMVFKIYTSVVKELKLKFRGLIPTFVEVPEKKLVRGELFGILPSWIGLKKSQTRIIVVPKFLFEIQYLAKFCVLNYCPRWSDLLGYRIPESPFSLEWIQVYLLYVSNKSIGLFWNSYASQKFFTIINQECNQKREWLSLISTLNPRKQSIQWNHCCQPVSRCFGQSI